ncbi:uncharacterized protein [Halyomorpha halys]|uniref:uncharacterized protein isoform X2 n=1 Tax=Halyomorpha halys TaxID=286706 RepID=UPI0006D51CFF|nr:uncharacterized protein LOC106688530 isoform X2 [Halyomorpha halys]
MGRKKLSLTDEERTLRKKEQMKKVYERQKLLKKRIVGNLHPRQLEKKRSRDRIKNLKPEQLKSLRTRHRIENLNPEQLKKLRTRRRVENLKPEQLERKRKHNITYNENIKTKRHKLMLDLYETGQQVEYLDESDIKEECESCGALTFEEEMYRSKNNCCHRDGGNSIMSIKEEITDEAEPSNIVNSGISIKEEMTDDTEPIFSSTDIKEEGIHDIYYDGCTHMKQEEEFIVPDEGDVTAVRAGVQVPVRSVRNVMGSILTWGS